MQQAVWFRARRKGMWDLWQAFTVSNSISRPWMSSSQKRCHQKVRSSMSSFFLLPVLVGSHRHIHTRWWRNKIQQRCQPDRLLPLSPIRAGFAVPIGLPAHLGFLWFQLQSAVILILKCSSPGKSGDWGYRHEITLQKRSSGAGPGPSCLCNTDYGSVSIYIFFQLWHKEMSFRSLSSWKN